MAPEPTEQELDRFHDALHEEYRELLAVVSAFDQRLLAIKGWGVTLSLASLGLGFQQDHYGLFLVAALSGLAFWVLEATTKLHQMRYYPRMGDIEVTAHELFSIPVEDGRASTPLIDWSWSTAKQRLVRPRRRDLRSSGAPEGRQGGQNRSDRRPTTSTSWVTAPDCASSGALPATSESVWSCLGGPLRFVECQPRARTR